MHSFLSHTASIWQFFACVVSSYVIVAIIAFERRRSGGNKLRMEQEIAELRSKLAETNENHTKTIDELKANLSEKENFILKFSHEIRNPLNSLLGNIEVLIETVVDEKALETLKDAKVCGEILLQLLNNVLDNAKISSRQLEVSISVCNIREFMEKMWIVCTEIIRKKRLIGTLCLDQNTPDLLDFDKHRLMQIMINMVSNATKFTDKGYVKIYTEFVPGDEIDPLDMKPKHLSRAGFSSADLSLEFEEHQSHREFDEHETYNFETLTALSKRFSKSNSDITLDRSVNCIEPKKAEEKAGYLRIEISDSGCGMTAEQTASLFQKFSQVNEESGKRQVGTGLGLWITKELVEIMNGKVEVYSASNCGTCFVIMIKTHSRIVDPKTKRDAVRLSLDLPAPRKDLNCMIVEDIPYNQEINRKFLEKCGINNIYIVSNGKEAYDLFISKSRDFFSFILMDLETPVVDGREACQLIRNYEKEMSWKSTKIIILTACSEPVTQDELLDVNGSYRADVFLSKPAGYDKILNTLKELNVLDNEDGLSMNSDSKKMNKKVLIAEDDMFNLDMMQKLLSTLGLECIAAANGNEAVKAFELNRKEIGVVLMDCEMPELNGFEATEQLVKLLEDTPVTSRIPVFGLSGHSGHVYEEKAKESGMEMLLTKPVSVNQLRALFKGENMID